MNIAIIGTGHVGGALAKNWASAGHKVHLGVKDLDNFKGKELVALDNITAHPIAEAVGKSEVILIAAPSQTTAEIVRSMGNVKDKVIIDAMNSVRAKPEGYKDSFDAIVDVAKGAEVVKCFNSTGFENMTNPVYKRANPAPVEERIDMFMAGDSKRGKALAHQLALDCGFSECYDFGGNDKVALLEEFALAWINLAIMQGHGRNIAFKIIKR